MINREYILHSNKIVLYINVIMYLRKKGSPRLKNMEKNLKNLKICYLSIFIIKSYILLKICAVFGLNVAYSI